MIGSSETLPFLSLKLNSTHLFEEFFVRKHHVFGLVLHFVGTVSILALTASAVPAAVWTANGTGLDSWNTAGNWDTGVPSGTSAVASFITKPSYVADVVRVDSSVIVGTINLQVPTGMTLAAAAGQHITLETSTGNAKIKCKTNSYQAPTISSPLVLKSDLDILVYITTGGLKETLNLAGIASEDPGTPNRNVNINDGTNGGILQIASTGGINVGGTVAINNGIVEVLPGGHLSAGVVTGVGRLNVEQTGGLTATSINNLGVLGLGGGVNLTIGGDGNPLSLTVQNVTATSYGAGTLTLDGGTLRYCDIVPAPANENLISDVAFQITPNGGTVEGNGGNAIILSPIVGTTPGEGILTINNTTGVLTHTQFRGFGSDYGGTNITGTLNAVWAYPESLSGPIDVAKGNSLHLESSGTANAWSQDITLHGPPGGGDWQTASLVSTGSGGSSAQITGTLTLTDDQATPIGADSFSHVWNEGNGTLQLSGKITGSGNLVFGQYAATDYNWPFLTIDGEVANDYGTKAGEVNAGVTVLKSGTLVLAKPDGVVAIPTAEMRIGVLDANNPGLMPTLSVENRNQFNPQCVVKMFAAQDRADAIVYASQTIGGLEAESSPATPATLGMTQPEGDPQRVIDLTIAAAADHFFTGRLIGAGNLVKNGDGKQSLTLFTAPYTGTTTINAGTMAFSGSKMPNGLLALVGPVSGQGTLEVFDNGNTPTVLKLTGETNLGSAVIGAADTLELASGTANAIGSVIGEGTLHVTDETTLTATTIAVDTLVIGGAPTAAATAVPEPSVFALLAIAGIAIAWFRLKK
jgi:autotransporter-associated beta strand protein